ncbi:unnamed protein product [Lota lota]
MLTLENEVQYRPSRADGTSGDAGSERGSVIGLDRNAFRTIDNQPDTEDLQPRLEKTSGFCGLQHRPASFRKGFLCWTVGGLDPPRRSLAGSPWAGPPPQRARIANV